MRDLVSRDQERSDKISCLIADDFPNCDRPIVRVAVLDRCKFRISEEMRYHTGNLTKLKKRGQRFEFFAGFLKIGWQCSHKQTGVISL